VKKLKLAVLGFVVALLATLGVAAPSQAHYDPWNTHTHCNSTGCYRSCSFWDHIWGCQDVYFIIW
jgi:hypothetical protein